MTHRGFVCNIDFVPTTCINVHFQLHGHLKMLLLLLHGQSPNSERNICMRYHIPMVCLRSVNYQEIIPILVRTRQFRNICLGLKVPSNELLESSIE